MFADTLSDLPTRDQILSMSGLDFMQGILDQTLPSPPIAETLGFQLHHVSKGKVIFRGSPGFNATNPMGTVHGGWYGTLLDSAMACAVMTMVPKGAWYTTLEYKVNITRNLALDTKIEAVGTVQHSGRSTGVAVGEMRGVADGKLYATGSTTCLIVQG